VPTLPVNTIFATRGSRTSAAATVSSQATTLSTPSGAPAAANRSAMRSAVRVVAGAGFSTTVLPAASAVATEETEIRNG